MALTDLDLGVGVDIGPPTGVLPAQTVDLGVGVDIGPPTGVLPAQPVDLGVGVDIGPPTGVLPADIVLMIHLFAEWPSIQAESTTHTPRSTVWAGNTPVGGPKC